MCLPTREAENIQIQAALQIRSLTIIETPKKQLNPGSGNESQVLSQPPSVLVSAIAFKELGRSSLVRPISATNLTQNALHQLIHAHSMALISRSAT